MKQNATQTLQDILEPKESASQNQEEAFAIGLLMIRIGAGVLWDRTRESISERFKAILHRLAPSATFELTGSDFTRCVVTFPTYGKRNADICVRAAHELIFGVMGQCEFADLHISRLHQAEDGSTHQTRLTPEELGSIVERAKLPDVVVPRQYGGKPQSTAKGAESKDFTVVPQRQRSLSAEYRFEPVWDAQSEVVCMYLCVAKNVVAKDEHDAPVIIDELTHKERTGLEFNGALAGIEQLLKCVEQDERFMLNIPIAFETLASPSGRTNLMQLLRGVLPVYRPYIIFTLTDIPIGVSAARLSDFVMQLRPFGRLTAVVPKGERNYSTYQNIGLSAIAADFSAGADGELRSRGDIPALAASGRNFKLGAALYGISDKETLAAATAADIRLFHGPCIGDGLPAPKGMTHLARSAVLPTEESAGEQGWL